MADPGRERRRLNRFRPERLQRAYFATTYRVHAPGAAIDLRVGQRSAQLDDLLERHGAQTWAFVSAANPGSKPTPVARNRVRHLALAHSVRSAGFPFLEATGIPGNSRWRPEPSLLVVGISREAARELGKRFGQHAIVAGCRGEVPELVWC